MAESTRKPPRVKPAPAKSRKVRLEQPFGLTLLVITEADAAGAEKVTSYRVSKIEADFGAAYTLAKLRADGGEVYHVHLDITGDSCTCKWSTYGSHRKPCRHVSAIRALLKAGRLP